MAVEESNESGLHAAGTLQMPARTAWPIILALGVTLVFAGMVTSGAVSVLGAIFAGLLLGGGLLVAGLSVAWRSVAYAVGLVLDGG